ncbi:MAG: hypothetical protein AB1792_10480 [Candidatus Zixiibacteriota bacterium]
MKRHRWLVAALLMPAAALLLIAAGPRPSPRSAGIAVIDNTTYFDANSLLMFVTNTGSFAYDKSSFLGKNDGLYFPKGTNKSVIFAAGIWLGAKVNGKVRTSTAEYANDFVPGPMVDGAAQPDQGGFHVYKIKQGDTRETSIDYSDWPFDDGAPALKNASGGDSLDAEGNRIPSLVGDQSLWAVYNDADPAGRLSDPGSGSEGPMGIEVQNYVWGYARQGALGQTIFMRYTLINKGSNRLDSAFVSLWADPDLGDASDDLVGCDSLLGLGYCYNSGDDATYGAAAPAVGFDFFQGPIVASAGDSAWISSKGRYIQGYRNLPMTSFNKYINATDPSNNIETYNYMLGLDKDGNVQISPETGEPTTYMMSGDPVAGTGWLDSDPADRRWMMTSGPFTMEPGDTQEVVAAVIVGQGADRLSSITELKRLDATAQSVFDVNFNIPGPPPAPTVWQIPNDGAVQLLWGPEADGNVQYGYGPPDSTGQPTILQTFVMEGFNIYQGASSSGPWTKIATFDVKNDVERIYMDLDNPSGKERVVVQWGKNTDLKHELWVTQDRIRGGTLVNNRPYYFAVTTYNYDDQNKTDFAIGPNTFGIIAESFENLPSSPPDGVTPRSMTGVLADTIPGSDTVRHIAGGSDGIVLIDYYDQGAITGATYRVNFNPDITWNLIRRQTPHDTVLLANQAPGIASQGADGMVLRVVNPPEGVKTGDDGDPDAGWSIPAGTRRWTWAGGAGDFEFEGFHGAIGWMSPCYLFGYCEEPGVPAYGIHNVLLKFAQVDENGNYDPSDPNVSYGYRYLRGASSPPARPEFEPYIKNTGETYDYQDFTTSVPLSAWDIDVDPPRRLAVGFMENNADGGMVDGKYWPPDYSAASNTSGSGPREWLWIFLADYSETPVADYQINALLNPLPVMYFLTVARRGSVPYSPGGTGEDQFEILANHVISPNDVYEFTTSKPGTVEGTVIANAVDAVHAVPNPYYNVTALEVDQFNRVLKFVNVPAAKTTIRIFNLAGDLVRTLVKDDPGSAEIVWDVLTETGLPVASGLYIYHVEAEGLGTKIGKVAVFTEVEQLNTY